MRTLIVDDDDDVREALDLALESEGFDVKTAVDGLDALGLLQHGYLPDVVLLDMMMPRMDGEAFLHALRAAPDWAHIPVVIISGHLAARQKAAQLGATASLVKPIELEQLLAVLHGVEAQAHPQL